MSSKWLFLLQEHSKQLWFRASLYCLLAVLTALLGFALQDAVPDSAKQFIKLDTVYEILKIMASSMLVVATFALSVMVQAYQAASTTATPRATQLVTEDTSAQNALAAFIGAFLFSIVGLIALSAGIYGEGGTVVLFASTILVVLLVVIMLLRWIEYLARVGRVEQSIDLVETATRNALVNRACHPYLGGKPLQDIPPQCYGVCCSNIGYLEYVDMENLQAIAQDKDLHVYLNVLPGRFCDRVHPVAFTNKDIDKETAAAISESLLIGDNRTFAQDPRFGFIVLAEIAMRALSPSMNDPGTAIRVLGSSVRLFHNWAKTRCEQPGKVEVRYDRVWARSLREEDLFDDAFSALVRDGAKSKEVSIRLRKALNTIAKMDFQPFVVPAYKWSQEVLARTEPCLTPMEFEQVEQAIAQDEATSGPPNP